MTRYLCVLFICLCGVGCSALNVQKPTASITGMTVENVNSNGFTMNFGVDLKNPNAVAIPLSAADYKIGLGGTEVVNGKTLTDGSIPASGTKSLSLPVNVNFESLLAAEQAIVKSGGNVPYALDGGLALKTGNPLLGDMRVPVQYSGTLPLKQILSNPKAMLQNPAAMKLAKELLSSFFR